MMWIIFIITMGFVARMAGNGFGKQWGLSWLPEVLYTAPFAMASGWGSDMAGLSFHWALVVMFFSWMVSYAGMQSATWMFLRWQSHDDPNTERGATIKPLVDWLAGRFGYKLGDEGYAWIAAGVKGFIIGLPVGGVLNAVLWPLGYEIGSHAKGRVEKLGIDPHSVSEFLSGAGGGLSIFIFIEMVKLFV